MTWGGWAWEEAWDHWRRALEINPNDANLNAYYAHFLCIMGLPEDALPFSERALDLDPYSSLYRALHGMTLTFIRRYDEAIATATAALELDPGMQLDARQFVYIARGMRDEQLAHQRERIANFPERVAAFEAGLEAGGYEGAQLALADLFVSQSGEGGAFRFNPWGISLRYLDGGDLDRAVDWMETATSARDPNVPYIGLPIYDVIRTHPRYPDLIRSIGFPEEVEARYLNEVR